MKAKKTFVIETDFDSSKYPARVRVWGKDNEGVIIESSDSGDNTAEVAKVVKVPEVLIDVLNNICADVNENDKFLNGDIKDLAVMVSNLEERIETLERQMK
jgi:hypothetical protein